MSRKVIAYLYMMAIILCLNIPSCAQEYTSTRNKHHAFEATSGDQTITSSTFTKTGGPAGTPPYEYAYLGANSAVFLSNDAKVTFSDITLNSNARYAQGIFLLGSPTATVSNSELYTYSDHSDGAYNSTGTLSITHSNIGTGRKGATSFSPAITTSGNNATTILTEISAWTSGDHSPVLKVYSADNATLTATSSEFISHGIFSPIVYSTGKVQIASSIMSADCSTGVVIDGNGQVSITDTSIDLKHITGRDTTHPAIVIGSALSGDSSFTMTGGHIDTDKCDIFSVSGTKAAITLSGVAITNADASANLLKAYSGNGTNSTVNFSVSGHSIGGNITANTGSNISAVFSGGMSFAGSVNRGNPNGAVSVSLQSNADGKAPVWYMTANSYVTTLTNHGTIIAGSHKLYVNGTQYTGAMATSDGGKFYAESEADSESVIEISTLALPSGKTDTEYLAYISATSPSSISYNVADGSLPDGLTLNQETGTLSGTPTTAGTYTFVVEAYNETYIAAASYTLVITDGSAASVTIATTHLNDAYTYTPYSAALAASGAGKITWSVESGFTLPSGLSLDASTGIISGTPAKTGTHTFMVRAEASSTNYDTRLLTLKVSEGSDVFKILTESLKEGTIGKNYNVTLKAKGSGTLTWSVTGLPDGLKLDTAKGKISGKPTTVGEYNPKFTVTNGTETTPPTNLAIVIKDVKPKIKAKVKAGMINTAYTATFTASAGTGTIYWELSGDLPSGLTFDEEKAIISGKPTEGWKGEIVIMATNTGGATTKKCKLQIKAIKPKFTFKNPPAATFNEPYEAEAQLTGTQPMTLEVKNLPAGLSYDYDTFDEVVKIFGTPTEGGKFTVKMTATNVQGKGTKSAKIVVNYPPSIRDFTLSEASTGKSYTAKFVADGTKKITWSIESGDLPNGLTLKSNNGQLKGKPLEGGEYRFYIVATNSYGSDTRSVDLIVKVTPPKISTNSLKKGKYNKTYSVKLKTKEGTPDSWDITGDLPAGITFTKGVFSGTPTEAFEGSVTVTASNAGGSDSKTYTLVVAADAPKVTTASLPNGTMGQEYSAKLEASGTPPIVWRWSGYPTGLTLSKDTGEISGIPTKAGTYKITVYAENSAKIVTKKYKVDIVDPSGQTGQSGSVGNVGDLTDEREIDIQEHGTDEYYSSTGELPEGCVIVAELGEVSVDVSGMYDFDVAFIDEAPVGARMYWFANSERPSDDDSIAEFCSTDGQEIDAVPEARKVKVSVWLNSGVRYRPVIFVL